MKGKVTLTEFFQVEWKVLLDLLRQHRGETILIIFFANISTAVSFVELKFLEFATDEGAQILGTGKETGRLVRGSLLFLGVLLLFKILGSIYLSVSEKYDDRVKARVKESLVGKLSRISYEYYERQENYEIINIAGRAPGEYTNAVYGSMRMIRMVCLLGVYSVLLSDMGPAYTMMLVVSIVVCTLFCGKVSDRQLDYWRKHVQPKTRRNGYFKGIFGSRINQQNIQVQESFSYFAGKFSSCNLAERRSYLKLNALSEITEILGNILFVGAFFYTSVTLGQRVVEGNCEIGYFTMIIALLGSMFQNLKEFTLFLLNNNEFIRVVSSYYQVLGWEEDAKSGELSEAGEKAESRVVSENPMVGAPCILLRDLRYQYPQAEKPALRGVNLEIYRGEKIALVGENGCGKTTMMSVVMGLLTSYQGICENTWISCAAVLQDFIEYEFSVRENIEMGCGGRRLSQERIEEILRQVGLYDYVMSLEGGIDTKLGQLDSGMELSKGQWQRLAVGRLLADEKADLWILDEPAAYLDPLAEIDVYKLIFGLAGDRTVLFTSHRLGFARFADRILVMEEGRIAEDGTHETLMKQEGIYSRMFEIQRKWYQ